jgi:hypothetical protein
MYEIPKGFSAFPRFPDFVQRTVMPVLTIANENLVAVGTCFAVTSDGLVMTAAHVIHEAVKRGTKVEGPNGGFDYELELYAVYVTDHQHPDNRIQYVGGVLPIRKVWHSKELDLCFCRLGSPYGDGGWMPKLPIFRLSPGLPKVGGTILGIGYYDMKGNVGQKNADGHIEVVYSQSSAYTQGRIAEIHPIQRDSGMLTFPCFRTDARFDPGMSGGPIIDERGNVCGVICSSLSAEGEQLGHVSYGSLIWPIAGSSIEVSSAGDPPEMTLVYDLMRSGYIQTDSSFANIQVVVQPNGSRTVRVFRPKA